MKLQERKKKGAGKVPRQGCGGRRAAVVETAPALSTTRFSRISARCIDNKFILSFSRVDWNALELQGIASPPCGSRGSPAVMVAAVTGALLKQETACQCKRRQEVKQPPDICPWYDGHG